MYFDKPHVGLDGVRSILQLFPFGPAIELQDLSGVPNTTYAVTTATNHIAIRIYSRGQSSLEHIRLELAMLEHLRRWDFPSPRLLRGKNGRELQEWNGYPVIATEFIDGTRADATTLTSEFMEDLGRVVGRLDVALTAFHHEHISPSETFLGRALDFLADLPRALDERHWHLDIVGIDKQCKRAAARLTLIQASLPSRFIHADIWPPNVICAERRVAGIMDFDDCCYGPSVVDIVIPLMEFAIFNQQTTNEDFAASLIAGYRESSSPVSVTEGRLFIEIMELTCTMWLTYYVVQDKTPDHAEEYLKRLRLLNGVAFRHRLRQRIHALLQKTGS